MVCALRIIMLFVVVEITTAAIFNVSILEKLDKDTIPSRLKKLRGRRNAVVRSTSSSSGEKKKSEDSKRSSLGLSEESSSSSDQTDVLKRKTTKKSFKPVSSNERRGWRKWHRKCYKCPEDMPLKWRDPTIKWICGAYQRARRSFKSLCMMHYRNCQDGTMFTKISDHRCSNDTDTVKHGQHFFYDYKVILSDESSSGESDTDTAKSSNSGHSSSSESWDTDKLIMAEQHINP